MLQLERDRMLLSVLPPDARAVVEEVVDEIIEETILVDSAAAHLAVAQMFEDKGADPALPRDEQLVALQIAAAIRMRIAKPELDS